MFSCSINHLLAFIGKKCANIFEPSNGGNGIKLNTPKPILTIIISKMTVVTIPFAIVHIVGTKVTKEKIKELDKKEMLSEKDNIKEQDDNKSER